MLLVVFSRKRIQIPVNSSSDFCPHIPQICSPEWMVMQRKSYWDIHAPWDLRECKDAIYLSIIKIKIKKA